MWLHILESTGQLKRVEVAPGVAPGTDGHSLSRFGYGTDGTMLNATVVFASVSAMLYSIELQEELPVLLKSSKP